MTHHPSSVEPAVLKAVAGLAATLCLVSCATLEPDTSTGELDTRLQTLSTYDYGADRAPVVALSDFLTDNASVSEQRAFEPRLVAFFRDKTATRASRQLVIRELGRIGTAASVEALIELLPSEEFADDAAMALERITDPETSHILRNALADGNSAARTRIIAILGQRRDAEAVNAIAPHLEGSTSETAVVALGHIATHAAVQSLVKALPGLKDAARRAAWHALLTCHAEALARGDKQDASAIALELDRADAPTHVRATATLVALQAGPTQDLARRASVLLASQDPARQAAGVRLARTSADDRALRALGRALSTFPPASQIAILGIVADRMLTEAAPSALNMAASQEPAVRAAALRALGQAGNAGCVDVLLQAAMEDVDENRPIARNSLRLITGPGVDERMLALADTPPVARQVDILTLIGERGMRRGLPLLFSAATHTNAAIREAAISSLGAVAGAREWPTLIALFAGVDGDQDIQGLVTAAATAGQRVKNPGNIVTVQLSRTSATPARIALLTLAGRLTADTALPELKRGACDEDLAVRQTALRALGNWKTTAALPALKAAAGDEQSRRLAQRAALDVIRNSASLDDAARIQHYREFAPLLEHVDEQRMLLSAVGTLKGPAALAFAAEFLDTDAVRAEAEAAVIGVAKHSGKPDAPTAAVLQRIAGESLSQAMQNEAKALLGL